MNKIYTLLNCSTCQKILDRIDDKANFCIQDIKTQPLTAEQLDELYGYAGSYEALFSKRARLYRQLDLKNQSLTEQDYRHYLLAHYTFLARPVVLFNEQLFIGNAPKRVQAMLDVVNAGDD